MRDIPPSVLLLLAPFLSVLSEASTLHVPLDFPSIGAAVDVAEPADTVLVAPGLYEERDIRIDVPLCLLGEPGAGDVVVRWIFGSYPIPDTTSIIFCTAEDVIIEGLAFEDGASHTIGGALLISGEATIRSCAFSNCFAWNHGGAIYVSAGAHATIEGTRFERNRLQYGQGGAIFARLATVEIVQSDFLLCGASTGGAIACKDSDVLIRDCRFEANHAGGEFQFTWDGGAVYLENCSHRVEGSYFVSNIAHNPLNGFGSGGALYLRRGVGEVDGCVFLNNKAGSNGGAVVVRGQCTLHHNTFFANGDADPNPTFGILGGHILVSASAEIRNNIFSDATDGHGFACENGASPTIDCNDFWNSPEPDFPPECIFALRQNNIAADPLFCDEQAQDLGLQSSSPCAPDYAPQGCGVIGAFGVACEPHEVQPTSWGRLKLRFHDYPDKE